jgi:hypothetical protein
LAIQTDYNAAPPKGFPGMVANGETSNRISRTCEDVAGIAFGKPVYRGTGDQGCTATPAAGTLLGFAIADHGIQPLPGGVAADIYPRYSSVGILNLGAMYVTVSEDVADGNDVHVTPAGLIVDTAGGANIAATGWKFDETVASGGICRIVRR